jgi:ATP-dependent RNA helicase DDX23/PRP28
MIDLGFEPQVSQILESMGLQGVSDDMADSSENVGRTTHMFTATMPSSVERLAKRFMKTPATLRIGDQDSGKNKRILQEIIFVPNEKRKRVKLLELLSSVQKPCIIFINAKKACNVIAREVEHAGYNCVVLHSDKSQDEREGALRDFKSGNVDLLIATDVAGRGLDINGVETVINYDMPSDISRYTHRIGRTGRAGKGGRATTLLTDDDSQIFSDLKAYLESTSQMVPSELSSRVSTLERSKGDRRMM